MPKTKSNHLAIVASAALLISSCNSGPSSPQRADESSGIVKHKQKPKARTNRGNDTGQCYGVNSCKGSSSCASANNSCAKQNTCRGRGWVNLKSTDCNDHDGKFKASN